ncbi:MAG: transporter family protein [Burkholderiales bacterium]|jgi:lipopolysaccharide transport system ATP-binding protein|nr:transporter family protein [Burkholderiales bacterium]
MDSNLAIKVENVSKVYKLYSAPIDRLKESLSPSKKKYHKDFYALNNVNFKINKGDMVGVIGKNGSGKSTLLKIITGVLTQTSGEVIISGKVAALLELGAGFNPEYTGIENIYFQGNLMGYSREEISNKVEFITNFADIGDFIYQPVKNYSSGMFARLAFAVAINVEPDILIVDEALAVGDMVFQAKCMTRMRQMMESGVTILFVSHDTSSVKSLCKKAIYLEGGCIKEFGDAAKVVGKYIEQQHLEMSSNLNGEGSGMCVNAKEQILGNTGIPLVVSQIPRVLDPNIVQRYGDGRGTILNGVILNSAYKPVTELVSGDSYYLQILVQFNEDLPTFACGASLSSLDGIQQLTWINSQDNITFPAVKEGEVYCITIKIEVPIKAGVYTLSIGLELPVLFNQQHQFLDIIMNFDVIRVNFKGYQDGFSSMFRVSGEYFVNRITDN